MEMKVRQKSKQAKKVVPIKNLSPDEVVQEVPRNKLSSWDYLTMR